MTDFRFVQRPHSKKWVIIDPRRSTRPDNAKAAQPNCPFCVGNEEGNAEVDRLTSSTSITGTAPHSQGYEGQASTPSSEETNSPRDTRGTPDTRGTFEDEWLVRVITNKFPFADIHELIIHSPDHHKNTNELPKEHAVRIFEMYQKRYKEHQKKGTVLLFHNRGEPAGESLPHPHTQLVVLPHDMTLATPTLQDLFLLPEKDGVKLEPISIEHFYIFSPLTGNWPDEVIIAPKRRKSLFSDLTHSELTELAENFQKVINLLSDRLYDEFPFNFYIYPHFDWYLRIVPRIKVLGGFEIATHIGVVTTDPAETMKYLQENWEIE